MLAAQGRSIKDAARALGARSDLVFAGSATFATSATSPANAVHGFLPFVADVAGLTVMRSALPQWLEHRLQCFCLAPLISPLAATCSRLTPINPRHVGNELLRRWQLPPPIARRTSQRHRDGLTGPVHFCAAIKGRSKLLQWYTAHRSLCPLDA